jgi:hypothetical protein
VGIGRGRRARWIVLGLVVFFALASLLSRPARPDQAAPPVLQGAQIDPQTLSILERSCIDCHSERTHYPWYSYVAPVAWLIASDVSGGRGHMNLSQWQNYPLQRRERLLSEIANQVKDRDMPLWQYLIIHRNAKLSDADIATVFQWTQKERTRLINAAPQ